MRMLSRFLFIASAAYVCSGLVLERKSNEADLQPNSLHKKNPNVLFIVAGLMRDYKYKWAIWQQTVVEPNKANGVNFTIVVETDLNMECDYSLLNSGHTKKELDCMCHWPREEHCEEWIPGGVPKERAEALNAAFERRIRKVFYPENIDVIHHTLPNGYMAQGKRSGNALDQVVPDMTGTKMENSRSLMKSSGDLRLEGERYESHVRSGSLALERYAKMDFDIVLSVRPDMNLVSATDKHYLSKYPGNEFYPGTDGMNNPIFDIKEVCRTHPGLNVISGDFMRPWMFHDRDWDWGSLLCDGSKLSLARETLYGKDGPCRNEECPNGEAPPLPADFTPTKPWNCDVYTCTWIAKLNNKIRFGTLDDVVFGHLARR